MIIWLMKCLVLFNFLLIGIYSFFIVFFGSLIYCFDSFLDLVGVSLIIGFVVNFILDFISTLMKGNIERLMEER